MNIHLPPDLEKLVQSKIEAGRFHTPDDVLRAALFMMEEQESFVVDADDARAKIAAGLKSLREGKGIDGDEAFARLEAELDAWERNELS